MTSLFGSGNIRQLLYKQVSAISGHEPDELGPDLYLEADLGLDSIKGVELVQSLLELIPADERDAFIERTPVERLLSAQDLGELEQLLLAAESGPDASAQTETALNHSALYRQVASVTGHEPAELSPDLFLEADLGLDSIKTVELMQSLLELVPESNRTVFLEQVPMERLMAARTLGELGDLLSGGAGATTAPRDTDTVRKSAPDTPPSEIDLGVLDAQSIFLVAHWCIGTLSLVSWIDVRGPFDVGLARSAWQDLTDRHPSLRGRFDYPENAESLDEYRFVQADNTRVPTISVHELSKLPPADQELVLKNLLHEALDRVWSIHQWPLHELLVVRLGMDRHRVIWNNSHLVSDGLSNQQAIREWLSLYQARTENRLADLPPATTADDYRQAVRALNEWPDRGEHQSMVEHLAAQGKERFLWNPVHAQVASRPVPTRTQRFSLDHQATVALLARTGAWRLSTNALIVSAYLAALARMDESTTRVVLNVPTSGRFLPGFDFSHLLGCFAQNLTLLLPLPSPDAALRQTAATVDRAVRDAVAAGVDRAQARAAARTSRTKLPLTGGEVNDSAAALVRAGIKSNLYLPYIGQTGIEESYGILSVVDYQAATSTSPATLDTLVEVFQGELRWTCNYDSRYFGAEFIAAVGGAFKDALHRLLAESVDSSPTRSSHRRTLPPALRQVAQEIVGRQLDEEEQSLDLEARLGIDSLERVRLVARLGRLVPELNRSALLSCRSLAEMGDKLDGGNAPSPADVTTSPISSLGASAAVPKLDPKQPPYQAIAACCRTNPNAVAIIDGAQSISYSEMAGAANRLAQRLIAVGVGPGELVGILAPRGARMVITILAVLKSGGAYMPMDPDYPNGRLNAMMQRSRLRFLITCADQMCRLPMIGDGGGLERVMLLDAEPNSSPTGVQIDGPSSWADLPDSDPPHRSGPDDLMTVLFTSGSTGKPKGVVLTHRGYANRFAWQQQWFELRAGERVAQRTSASFDVSIWEMLWPLTLGATVCPVSTGTIRDPWALADWMRRTRINVMHFVPSLFGEFLTALEDNPTSFTHLRWLIFSGEALPVGLVRRWQELQGPTIGLANLYGPTEASIDVTAYRIPAPLPAGWERIPIGHAMPGVSAKVLDERMGEVPLGETGELWLGGVQLAIGYINDPDRSNESFPANPFKEVPGERLYRTGDRVRVLSDGQLDFLGRMDNQVKLRGFRVELGEVEAVLGSHPAVREVAALVQQRDSGAQKLLVCVSGDQTQEEDIIAHAAKLLPSYMQPQQWRWLTRLPKNHNGKLDRVQLASDIAIPTPPTREPLVTSDTAEIDHPPGPAQRWLMHYFDPPWAWSGYTRFRYRQPLDLDLFRQAVAYLANRHAALRIVFAEIDGQWRQRILKDIPELPLDTLEGSHVDPETCDKAIRERIREISADLRIDRWPLWRALVVRESSESYDIALVGHHMISDLLSNQILFRELWKAYGDLLAHRTPDLGPDPPHYGDYVAAWEREVDADTRKQILSHWTSRFPGPEYGFRVPLDLRGGVNDEASQAMERFSISAVATSLLLKQAKAHFSSTLYPLLLVPLYRSLGAWTGQDWVVISHRNNGRSLTSYSFSKSVGNFAVNFPLATDLSEHESTGTLVAALSAELSGMPLGPASYDWVGEELPSHLYPDVKLTPVRANYLGNRDLPENAPFEFSDDSRDQRFAAPEQRRTALLEFFFSLRGGRLRLDISYSRKFHRRGTIENLGEQYLVALEGLLDEVRLANVGDAAAHRPPSRRAGELDGKTVLVTGAGRGIGRGIALALAVEGVNLGLLGRNRSSLEETARQCRQHGCKAVELRGDVTEPRQVSAAVSQLATQFGPLYALVNNAGITGFGALAESPEAAWRRIVEVNLMGTYNCCRAAIAELMDGGRIVNMGSDSSVIGYPLFSAYAASKHAVLGMTKALAEELKPRFIAVNAVCPAFVDTDMTPQAFRANAMPVEQIADVVVFLLSSQAAGITGECLKVFGQQDMHWYGSQKMDLLQSALSKTAKAQLAE